MLVPNRHKSFDDYRYGFNTQEKVDEISGEGNHFTAPYWEYDSRTGRRWNIDPVVKSWLSGYSVLSNSPICRVDPDGNDDYFDLSGNFLRRDDKSTNLIVLVNDKGVEEYLVNHTFTKNDINLLIKIGEHYSDQIGVNYKSLKNNTFSAATRITTGTGWFKTATLFNSGKISSTGDMMNTNVAENTISFSLWDGQLPNKMGDYNNFRSNIYHEWAHKLVGEVDTFSHLKVYYMQLTHYTFKNTTLDYKNKMYENINQQINAALAFNDKSHTTPTELKQIHDKAREWKAVFEKLGADFEQFNKKNNNGKTKRKK